VENSPENLNLNSFEPQKPLNSSQINPLYTNLFKIHLNLNLNYYLYINENTQIQIEF
jgi:hypothetical protein